MAQVAGQRMAAEIDGDFVVFLIGARFNKFRLLQSLMDLGGRRGMKHMLDLPGRASGQGPARLPDGPASHRAVLAVPAASQSRRQLMAFRSAPAAGTSGSPTRRPSLASPAPNGRVSLRDHCTPLRAHHDPHAAWAR